MSANMMPWPGKPSPREWSSDPVQRCINDAMELMYAYRRAEAAMERLRLAVEALKHVRDERPNEHYYVQVDAALEAIGEIP